ncbi:BMP family ABC transporter substrate-binding protein [Defluviitalea raffinosedens]|jgi:basic membrane lipoprotein Med (substrate-binding protein (PBP1-ABC) superfamily)|uniref:BMP family ABC transporter substrate-binding protein n=1 Tax=Defluviitalea raffinosedens TaxID=1450156 RepID=A0A7C8LHG0_9FIRM|nr:BMP family ABC transporter substrate-binding protein [Defluviitalea raffinosedens]KAE9635016.1 BMP family ABC transporter substrate-binding protein [Defluviitalea raffinosedens]MBM7686912.1 basic membrane lipoprotein Med (substrate-binding protein (PBP1-ABC) superfamily) [Defluviitalea raffinosedens]HHW67791.1 BMP family ABC transporter substrate-binding protein [Candidatus Epulonipiscium sp.]
MNKQEADNAFQHACKLGKASYSENVSKGISGYLPSLGGIVKNSDIASEINLGIVEIPLKKIIGTYSHSRSIAFASNFMPLISGESEFKSKWTALYIAHMEEGIRDPIKVYEYLNWFYVVEGNKRVSVLKYCDAYGIAADVTRLIPKKDESDPVIKIYYEFLEFNKQTGINSIWFSKENGFTELGKYLQQYSPNLTVYSDKYKHFMGNIYRPFREIYHRLGGDKLNITTGDALLEYIKIYGLPDEIKEDVLRNRIKKFMTELEALSENQSREVRTDPIEVPKKNVISSLTTLMTSRKNLRVAFVYAKTIKSSGWTYAHNLGRLHVENVFKDQITTTYLENVPESNEAYKYLKELAKDDYDIIFTTSPTYINPTLKAALEFPNVKFLNCSETHSFRHVSTYFGRIHEPRFLTGIIAGSLTKTNIIGYVATYPIPEVITGINAFALGARMVNPYVKVKVEWTHKWDQPEKAKNLGITLNNAGADIISHDDLPVPGEVSKEYGVYSLKFADEGEKDISQVHFALPIWNWGIFYERLLRNILSGTWRVVFDVLNSNPKLVNFWWGMDTGMVDIIYSKTHVPLQTQCLVELMKKMIVQNEYYPFTGPIYDQNGNLRIPKDETASYEQILSMNWFVDGVEGEIPILDDEQRIDPLTEMLGIKQ